MNPDTGSEQLSGRIRILVRNGYQGVSGDQFGTNLSMILDTDPGLLSG